MKVELLDHMGSDLDVVNAARVSFDKESEWNYWPGEDGENHPELKSEDNRLIWYLAKHGHWTPFSHCYAKFRIKAPLFVRSQLFKHKIGLTENEVSRRYVDSEPEFYIPEVWRKRAEDKKQGSTDEAINPYEVITDYEQGWYKDLQDMLDCVIDDQKALYRELLDAGVCPEQARMVLPQSMMTEWIWSGSLAAFARVYALRTSDHAQWETKQIAIQIGEALKPLFPISWEALTNAKEP